MAIELGKPADYGQFILERRYRLAAEYAGEALGRGGVYLDVGCGNGAQTLYFASHFAKWRAIDVEEDRLEEFRRELARGSYPQKETDYEILRYDGDRLPFNDNSFDFLTCIEVIEHTKNDQ